MSPHHRYERPQRGRYRQFHQHGVEFLGSDHIDADVEVICAALEFVDRLELHGSTSVLVNSLGDQARYAVHRTANVLQPFIHRAVVRSTQRHSNNT